MSAKADPREPLRFSGNPILRPHDFPKLKAVFNPGATVFEGRTLLPLRVEYRTGLAALAAATSDNGLTDWEIDPVRGLHPIVDSFEEHWGVQDPASPRWATSTSWCTSDIRQRTIWALTGGAADLPRSSTRSDSRACDLQALSPGRVLFGRAKDH